MTYAHIYIYIQDHLPFTNEFKVKGDNNKYISRLLSYTMVVNYYTIVRKSLEQNAIDCTLPEHIKRGWNRMND